jgi:hypothetical protein
LLHLAISAIPTVPHIDEALVSRLSDLDYVIGVRWRR